MLHSTILGALVFSAFTAADMLDTVSFAGGQPISVAPDGAWVAYVLPDSASQILSLRKQLEALRPQAEEEKLNGAIATLDAKLTEVLNALVELRFRGIDDQMLVYPLKLNVAIASLQRAVASADRSPTEQNYTVFRQRSVELGTQLEKLAAIVEDDIPALNRSLRAAGFMEISTNK